MHRNLMYALILVVTLLFAGGANAQNIFVWENDNNLRIIDEVLEDTSLTHQAFLTTLELLEYEFDSDDAFPEDLSGYDIVIVANGFSCPS